MSFLRNHLRWGVVVLLFCTAMLNNLDRMILSVLAPTLKQDLSFGDVEYSYVVVAFLAAYAIGYTFCGKVLDRAGVKLGIMGRLSSGRLRAWAMRRQSDGSPWRRFASCWALARASTPRLA